jgi:enoyl-CoA hydratase
MTYAKITYQTRDGIAILTLANPPANTYSYEMMRELDDALLQARMDAGVYLIVVTGAGDRFFCAGADVRFLRTASSDFKYYFCLHANETLLRFEQTPKLVIAALNGHTVGGGLEIALAADLRVARKSAAKVGLPEVSLGVLPGTGGTQRLARLLGPSKSIELIASGRLLSFEEALQLGLVNVLWDDSHLNGRSFLEAVVEYAKEFTPPHKASFAVGRIKRAVQSGSEMAMAEGLALERELQQQLFTSADAQEGLSAYMEKRPPHFEGR